MSQANRVLLRNHGYIVECCLVSVTNYLRFATTLRCPDTARPLGIFRSAGKLRDTKKVEPWAGERIEEICKWFNANLPCPHLDGNDWRAIFWFRSERQPMVRMLWELAAIIEEHGVFVEFIAKDNPGMIVYNDEFQVAAIPHSGSRR